MSLISSSPLCWADISALGVSHLCDPRTLQHGSALGMGLCSLSSVTGEREELELLFKLRLRRKRSTRDFFQRAEHEGMSGSCLRHVCSLGRVTLLLPCAVLVEQVQFAPACLKSEEAQRLSEQPGGSHAGEGCGECPCLSGGPRSWGSGRLQLLSCGTEGGSKSPLLLQCPGGRGSQPLSLEQLCSLSHRCPCSQQQSQGLSQLGSALQLH